MPHLTDKLVKGLKPTAERIEVADDAVPGLRVRVGPSGKAFYLRYRATTGEQRNPQLGAYPTVSVAAARDIARDMLEAVRRGGDPSRERREQRTAATFADVATRWLDEHAEPTCKPSTAKRYRELVTLHLVPVLGSLKIEAITRADLERAHRKIGDKPGRGGRKAKGTANRALLCASAICNWAEGQGMRAQGSNPARGVKRFGEQTGGHYYSASELARIDAVLTAAAQVEHGHAGSFGRATVAAIRLLMLTGARLSEVTNLRWSEIDLERGMLVLVDSKSGRSVRPLTPPAVDLLRTLQRERDKASVYVCPSSNATPLDPTRVDRAWRSVRRLANLPAGVRLHDLRHTAGSIALEAGVPLPVVSKMLGHKSVATTARVYAHALDATQHLARFGEAFADKLTRGAEANREESARVVALPRKRAKAAK